MRAASSSMLETTIQATLSGFLVQAPPLASALQMNFWRARAGFVGALNAMTQWSATVLLNAAATACRDVIGDRTDRPLTHIIEYHCGRDGRSFRDEGAGSKET